MSKAFRPAVPSVQPSQWTRGTWWTRWMQWISAAAVVGAAPLIAVAHQSPEPPAYLSRSFAHQTAPQPAREPAKVSAPGVHPISGRRYAQPMSYLGADWLDRSERVKEEEPDIALDALALTPGLTVADVGAGSGYMTVKLARRVGPTGKVYANDIQPEMLAMLRDRLTKERITNVELVLGDVDSPNLPPGAIDLILMVDVYHEFSEPQKMLRQMRQALKPGGRLVLLEYRKEDPFVPIRLEHKMTVAEAKMEVEAEGFTLSKVDPVLPRQHILIFRRP